MNIDVLMQGVRAILTVTACVITTVCVLPAHLWSITLIITNGRSIV